MQRYSWHLAILIVAYLVFVFNATVVQGCPPPDCGPCEEWDVDHCVSWCSWDEHCCTDYVEYCCGDDEECCEGSCCSGCYTCSNSECVEDDSKCGDADCWDCIGGDCVCDITINSITNPETVCIDNAVQFEASVTGSCSCVEWSGGGEPSSASGCTLTTVWDTAGLKTVTASTACGDSEEAAVKIVEVESLLPDEGKDFDDGA